MKKVICVDDSRQYDITLNKEYEVEGDHYGCYKLTGDSGFTGLYPHSFFKDKPAFTYGQEVEVCGNDFKYGCVRATFLAFNSKGLPVVELGDGNSGTFNLIRPIRSVKQQIVEVLKPKLAFNNLEEVEQITDKILEITKNDK